jgi:hypothetical protein
MPKVLADREEVVFQEGIPENPSHIYELLMGAFAEQRRSLVKFIVDGEDALQTGEFPEKFELIEAESLTHDEITFRLSIDLINQMTTQNDAIAAYQNNILVLPWSQVVKQMDAFIQKIQPFADLIDHITPYAQSYSPPWRKGLEEVAVTQANSLNKILTSFENFDPAGLSDELHNVFIPLSHKTIKLFADQIIPFLKEETEKQKASL